MKAQSIHTLAPLESGGSHARNGFLFQDHVAAGYCLEMVLGNDVGSVWCETMDDITLIRQTGEKTTVDFVQVKATESDQLWSISQLCQRKGAVVGTSILERSLANDRCAEECCFSIVTARGVRSELKPLSLGLMEPSRLEAMPDLGSKLVEKLPDYESPNGHEASWWAERATWHVRHDSEAVSNHNRHLLSKIVHATGHLLFPDQIETVYELLLNRIVEVSAVDKTTNRNAGKLECGKLTGWLKAQIKNVHKNARAGGCKVLASKLEAAGLDEVAIAAATELRRSYRERTFEPSYLDLETIEVWENKVQGLLNRLRATLDSGGINDSGVGFHGRTLEALATLRSEGGKDAAPPEETLQGCMYHITALCQHRFVRPEG